jgi:hypothetical protein
MKGAIHPLSRKRHSEYLLTGLESKEKPTVGKIRDFRQKEIFPGIPDRSHQLGRGKV